MNRSAAARQDAPILSCSAYGHVVEKVSALHDWMGDAADDEPLIPHLDPDARTYLFADLRGYGKSRHLSGAVSAAEVAGDAFLASLVERFLEANC